jgi:hypothetical protein
MNKVKDSSLIIFSVPAMLLAQYLKKSEQLDITYNTNIFLFNKYLYNVETFSLSSYVSPHSSYFFIATSIGYFT